MDYRKHYLQKMIFVMKKISCHSTLQELFQRLQKEDIVVEICSVEEIIKDADFIEDKPIETGREGMGKNNSDQSLNFYEGRLYVTEDGKAATHLLAHNCAVLGWYHADNMDEHFEGIKYVLMQPELAEAEYFERVYRRYAGISWSILETERCYVRETCEEDVEAFFEIYKEPDITRYTDALYENSKSERGYVREYIEKVYSFYEFGIWTILLKETGQIIGRAGLSMREGYEWPQLGYVIGVPWQGKGLGREVCQGILAYAKEELAMEKIQVLIHAQNKTSLKLAEKLGFQVTEEISFNHEKYLLGIRDL